MEEKKKKLWKPRWIAKALTWKFSSTLLGGAIVHLTTGEWKVAALYVCIYTPISLLWFVGHEWLWQLWKLRKRAQEEEQEGVIEEQQESDLSTQEEVESQEDFSGC